MSKIISKPSLTIVGIILVAVVALFFNFPGIWDRGADNINDLAGFGMLPHFFKLPFKLGLDLQGGAHLVYSADLSSIDSANHNEAMEGVRDVVERRVNLFGVAEPIVQINKVGSDFRLIVELAGIQDVSQAIEMIGQTPYLEFKTIKPQEESEKIMSRLGELQSKLQQGEELTMDEKLEMLEDPYFESTQLNGSYLESAQLAFDQQTLQSQVDLQFNSEGSKIFEELTRENIGQPLAIYLDGIPVSIPVVQDVITGGRAQISGSFNVDEARQLAQRLNAGALPVPITLISQQTIGPSLGRVSLDKSLTAGILGFAVVLIFMILYYRLPGLMASLALLIYLVLLLAVFKIIPVTLTLAGMAGVILSLGMAVDANVLIFERFREEFKAGRSLGGSIDEGFRRAWPAIRDGNISTIITCIILFIFATGLVKGFALTLGIGVVLSMFSAIIVTKSFLRMLIRERLEKRKWMWR